MVNISLISRSITVSAISANPGWTGIVPSDSVLSFCCHLKMTEDDTSDQCSTNQKPPEDSSHHAAIDENQPMYKAILTGIGSHSSGHPSSLDIAGTRERLTDPLLLLCCEDLLRLYGTKHSGEQTIHF